MKRTSFSDMPCPLARALEHLSDGWSMLVLRDAFYGMSRFDEFKVSLGIASNTLTRVLKNLVEGGVLERRPYSDKPPRYEYVLTQKGHDLRPVMLTLLAWGNAYGTAGAASLVLTDDVTGQPVDLQLIDKNTGLEIGTRHKVHRRTRREVAPRAFAFPNTTVSEQS
jgi:DNA-binding HxlR family transcriptional regulator